jgi:pimeloyl-ACP methyl ester carboxylesterase
MPRAIAANGTELHYDTFGDATDPCVLLVMGFAAQMTAWDEEFCQTIAAGHTANGRRGRFVVRFDNRDCGLSTKLDGVAVDLGVLMGAMASGDRAAVADIAPYTLSDMAIDALGVLDTLHIERAHIVGASMGGMIAQTLAIEHPHRVLTLTSIMSSTGEQHVGQAKPEAMAALLTPAPAEREAYLDHAVRNASIIGSPVHRDDERSRARAGRSYDRSYYPEGAARQLTAIVASGERSEALPGIGVPSLVIHGRADPLIDMSGGLRTAELIPLADLLVLGDMGHDLPPAVWPRVVGAIVTHTR